MRALTDASLRTRLRLEEVEFHEVPAAPDPTGSSALLADTTAAAAQALPHVTIDYGPLNPNPNGGTHLTQIVFTIHLQDGTVHSVTVNIPLGSSPSAIATYVSNQLIANGFNATVNGTVVTLWGKGGVPVDNVVHTYTNWGTYTYAPPKPTVTGFNEATIVHRVMSSTPE